MSHSKGSLGLSIRCCMFLSRGPFGHVLIKQNETKLKLCSQVVFVQVVRNIHEVQLLLSLLGACISSVHSFFLFRVFSGVTLRGKYLDLHGNAVCKLKIFFRHNYRSQV